MIKLYTTHCQNCKALESKLQSKEIEYEEITDEETMRLANIRSVPTLVVDGDRKTFYQAVQWVNER